MTKSVAVLFGAAALALTITAGVAADITSANGVLPGCRDVVNSQHDAGRALIAGLCAGIIRGIIFVAPEPPSGGAKDLCLDIPKGVTTNQQIRIVIAYIEARPALMHKSFDFLALQALRTAWPCR